MEYPRTVVLENAKLKELLTDKQDLILVGRQLSEDIEAVEAEMAGIDQEVRELEAAVPKEDIDQRAKEATDEMNVLMAKMEQIKADLSAKLKAAIPPEIYARYEEKEKRKKELEEERNKIGLKVQQKNDKIVPLTRKLMKPYLNDEYEDYDTIRIEDGQIVGTIFSHIETFKENFAKRKK